MNRYIDADKIDWRLIIPTKVTIEEEHIIYRARKLLDSQPKLDAVEVVRCKDCKYYKIDHPRANGYHCCYRMHSIFPMKPDDFCSYGERRKNEV